MIATLPPPVRSIAAEHPRHLCGYDTLYVTPPDAEGFQYIHVFKMIPSRLLALYPSKTLSAESLASAAFQFFVTYGITDVLITDPGSNITSEVMKLLLAWFGVRLRVSLTGRHQSNGVERSHREILRFLTVLVNEEDLKSVWSRPHVLGIVQFILNSEKSLETGVAPFEYTFGTSDLKHFILPVVTDDLVPSDYVQMLNEDLRRVREAAKRVQEAEQLRRKSGGIMNYYVTGEMVLFDEASKGFREKLKTRFSGPYIVTSVNKADISCVHVVTMKQKVFHMSHLKPFFGSKEDEYRVAKTDDDQYRICSIREYKGDPEKRTKMDFLVLFEFDDERWLPYSTDLASSGPFKEYCLSLPELEPLTMSEKEWRVKKAEYNAAGVVGVVPGDFCLVNLKAWGSDYYFGVGLPLGITHVVQCNYVKWTNSKRKKIDLTCQFFKQHFEWDAVAVRMYGRTVELCDQMVLVDGEMVERYPALMSE